MQHLAEGQQADGDDDDVDAVEQRRHAEGVAGGAADAVDADQRQRQADGQRRNAFDRGVGDDGGGGDEGDDGQGEVLGRAEHGGQLGQHRGEEHHQDGGQQAAGEGADGGGRQRLGGRAAFGHPVALEGGGDRRGVAGGVHQDGGGGVAEQAAVVDAGEHDERADRVQAEGHRQQQRHRHRRAQAGQHADGGAEERAESTHSRFIGVSALAKPSMQEF